MKPSEIAELIVTLNHVLLKLTMIEQDYKNTASAAAGDLEALVTSKQAIYKAVRFYTATLENLAGQGVSMP